MDKKNFLFGVLAGVVGTMAISALKPNLKPLAINMVQKTLEGEEKVRELAKEVLAEAMAIRESRIKEISGFANGISPDDIGDGALGEQLELLKNQVRIMEDKLKRSKEIV